jgi:hypothetical protein
VRRRNRGETSYGAPVGNSLYFRTAGADGGCPVLSRSCLGIAALEDKIVQRAVVAVLSAIYEEDFLGFSYGFRPKRSQHDALDALMVGIQRRKVSWILDADYRSFFETVSHSWLLGFPARSLSGIAF